MSVANIHPDFYALQTLVYEPHGLLCSNSKPDSESREYGACTFVMNNCHGVFRVGKITPTKIGQFVTLWKRSSNGPIMPYDMADPIDFFIVSVRSYDRWGQFVFPKVVLHQKGIISQDGQGGKRAMRIYPSWDVAENPQAKRTQAWQLTYFFEINPDHPSLPLILEKLVI